MNLSAIPVVYYHSIKYKVKKDWFQPQIILTLKNFERHLRFFKTLRLKTFFMDDLFAHLKGEVKLPFNSLIIHFDDGYLDNFVFAFPLLKKYNMKATFWISPEFIEENDNRIRPSLEDYWTGKKSLEELNEIDGFLNWAEMRLMEKSGLIDIQSHTMTHNKYPISDKIIDFVNPKTKIDWLYWYLFPNDKPHFLTTPKYKIPLGYPIYESEKGNIAIKYEENGKLTRQITEYVKNKGNEFFFQNANWKKELLSLSESIKEKNFNLYKKEDTENYILRIKKELVESKTIIEKKLNKKVNHLCWPFGGWNEKIIKLADNAGYLTNTAKGQKNIFRKIYFNRVSRIALDNPKYQNILFPLYAFYKLITYKF